MQLVNPKVIKEVPFGDATFKIGILPFGKRIELESVAFFNGKAETREQILAILQQNFEFVKWGIKGHSNLALEDGTQVEFKADPDGSVSEETMNFYSATPGVLTQLSSLVQGVNYLKKDAVKN